ncbi:hypothetical protein HDU96_006145 [Phlyctochytrium bullatum]|nr:hypothetical protein HDU96_006145 [Phlyctochytrium bullatum]
MSPESACFKGKPKPKTVPQQLQMAKIAPLLILGFPDLHPPQRMQTLRSSEMSEFICVKGIAKWILQWSASENAVVLMSNRIVMETLNGADRLQWINSAKPIADLNTATMDEDCRISVASKTPSTGLKRQNPIRAPLSSLIVAIVVVVSTLVEGIVGYLTISDLRSSINDITTQMRAMILEQTVASINSTLEMNVSVLKAKASDVGLFKWVNRGRMMDDGFLDYPEIIGIYYNGAVSVPQLSAMGFYFAPDEKTGYSTGFLVEANLNIMIVELPSKPLSQVYPIIGSANHSPIILPTPVDELPKVKLNQQWPILASNGYVPGSPFFGNVLYQPEARRLYLPLIWPVWRNLTLGVPGPGPYWAVHAAVCTLDGIERFLRTLRISRNGIVAIVEGSTGLLVSASAANSSFNDMDGTRFPATASPNHLIAAAATFMATRFGNATVQSIPVDTKYDFGFPAMGDTILVNAQWLVDDAKGLRWLVMVIIPSNDFLESVGRSITRTIVSVACICITAVLLAILLSCAITAPLTKLVKAMVEATAFDFSALGEGYLSHRSHVKEIGVLQGVFNEMLVNFANAIRANKALNTFGQSKRDSTVPTHWPMSKGGSAGITSCHEPDTPMGLKRQNPIRAPLSVFIVAIVVLVSALVGGIVGHLTISDLRGTITDITTQMRVRTLEQTIAAVNSTLELDVGVLRAKVSDVGLFEWVNRARIEEEFFDYLDIISIYYNGAITLPQLSAMGFFFAPNETTGDSTGFIVEGDLNILSVDFASKPFSQLYHITGSVNHRPIIIPTQGWQMPKIKSALRIERKLSLPPIWPVWRNQTLGVSGPGPFWGIHMAIFTLDEVETFLKTLRISRNGIVAIVEGSTGLLVSASEANSSFNDTDGSRFLATESPNHLIAAASKYMAARFGNGSVQSVPVDTKYEFGFPAMGDTILVNAKWLVDDGKALRWLVMVIIPSNDFLESVGRSVTRTIISVASICVASVLLAILLSWAITAPLRKLVRAMVEAASFDFSALGEGYLSHRSNVTEIGRLQGVFNEMLVNFANAIRANKALNTFAHTKRDSLAVPTHWPMSKGGTADNTSTGNGLEPPLPLRSVRSAAMSE